MSRTAPKKPRPSRASGITAVPTPTTREWARMYTSIQRQMPQTQAEKERSIRAGKHVTSETMRNWQIRKRLNARLVELGLMEPEKPTTIVEVQCKNHKTGVGHDKRCKFRLVYTQDMVVKLDEGKVVTWCCPMCRFYNRTKKITRGIPKESKGPPTMEDWQKYEERCKAIAERRQGVAMGYDGAEPATGA